MVDLNKFVEVKLKQEDDFLKVRETLTRIGVSSRKDKILYQSCHILHKQGKYYSKSKYSTENEVKTEVTNLIKSNGLIGFPPQPDFTF